MTWVRSPWPWDRTAGRVDIAVFMLTWAAGVAALTAGALRLGRLGRRDWHARDRALAWMARLAPVLGLTGPVAAGSVVFPWFPLGLAFFTRAEEMGTAPSSGSVSPLLTALAVGGVTLLLLALCATIAVPVLAGRHTGGRSAVGDQGRPR